MDVITTREDEGKAWEHMLKKPLAEITLDDVEKNLRADEQEYEVFVNETYQVHKRTVGDGELGRICHLSIKRKDREPVSDWRDKQAIKNQLCGDAAEGLELYPAESRVVDSANQFHLWVFLDSEIPVGFEQGLKLDSHETLSAAQQRPMPAKVTSKPRIVKPLTPTPSKPPAEMDPMGP